MEYNETELKLRGQLLAVPRSSRVAEQGESGIRHINGALVVRLTRRYWRINGTPMKLAKAIETIQ